jgi:hypothetical protein
MLLLVCSAWLLVVPTPVAQSVLDRTVARGHANEPLRTYGVGAFTVSRLATLAGVPMGFESARDERDEYWLRTQQPVPPHDPIAPPEDAQVATLSDRTLSSALEALVSLDSRYEWQEVDGVVVIRPVVAWHDTKHVLSAPVSGIDLRDVAADEALALAARLLGHLDGRNSFQDTKRFSVSVPSGNVLDVLNAIVRAHGELTWTLDWNLSRRRRTDPVYSLTLWMKYGGQGIAILPGRPCCPPPH